MSKCVRNSNESKVWIIEAPAFQVDLWMWQKYYWLRLKKMKACLLRPRSNQNPNPREKPSGASILKVRSHMMATCIYF
jgi:hypothetical protein